MARKEKVKKEKKKVGPVRRLIETLLLIVAICVFIYAGFNLYKIYSQNWEESKETEKLQEIINVPKDEKKLDTFEPDFAGIREINPDIVGWIVVLDTDISYPVVKGQDNEYYLTHTAYHTNNYAGAIFMDYRQNPDLSAKNTFIYGHNVHHGTMFAELANYMDQSFLNEHRYFYYYTPEANYKLEVYSAYVDKGTSDSYTLSYADDNAYQNYLNYVKSLSRVQTDVEMSADDHMITLYTCSYESGQNPSNTNTSDIEDRYFIHGKIIKALKGDLPKTNEI
ncbi:MULTISPECIES: class B sortase [Breznakia]|uniref:Sortase B n=1 Tax=Breznakia blatticola TaxID=1754012 RepID=A0A4R8A5D8_9FIRM|nr:MULTISPECIES: class B sortase [Breznakia]MDH6367105.1 sortase B [Breznakia sp. PH1-1]MDH6404308.1 sortase B [Breznakia sp. PF1-11]MDH6411992.1 sortase B [Breznakia sp. PFB1-11]MDH6414296.1 sortase B [Breznakia sp. PFB1-14]MDH6416606.1 sortase B [Breznakia sp. PFB1-4]